MIRELSGRKKEFRLIKFVSFSYVTFNNLLTFLSRKFVFRNLPDDNMNDNEIQFKYRTENNHFFNR